MPAAVLAERVAALDFEVRRVLNERLGFDEQDATPDAA
jgi:hypothetical protein